MRRRFAEEKIATKYIKVKHREREIVVILEKTKDSLQLFHPV